MDEIYNFVSLISENVAINIYNEILDSVETLRLFPYIAPIEPYLNGFSKQYRSLVVKKRFKVVYYVKNKNINIVTIWDCRQNPNRLKNEIK
jgi:plasmid stabilization system protein ParE